MDPVNSLIVWDSIVRRFFQSSYINFDKAYLEDDLSLSLTKGAKSFHMFRDFIFLDFEMY